jgi:DNA-binding transcriptional LysR family regulator
MKVTLAQLRLLLTVVQTRSVGAAARKLSLTQSGASLALIALEKTLGAPLATRTRDGIVPTAFALAILRDAEIASNAVRRIEQLAREAGAAPDRPLRIASVPSVAARLLPQWSKSFRQLYPAVTLSIFEGHHIEVGEWVRQGVADIGLTAVAPAGLNAERIREEEMIVVARRGHRVLRDAIAKIENLCSATLVTAGLGCDPLIEDMFAAIGRPIPRRVRAQDIATALNMVREEIGVTILPDTAFPRSDMHDLRMRRLAPGARRQLFMIAAPDQAPSRIVGQFLEIVRAEATAATGISNPHVSYS